MKTLFCVAAALACLWAPAAFAQDEGSGLQEELTGTFLDNVTANGDVLYQLGDVALDAVPALAQRHMAVHLCFIKKGTADESMVPEGYDLAGGESLSDLLPKYLGQKLDQVTLMRVERSYVGDDFACGLLEVTYAEK